MATSLRFRDDAFQRELDGVRLLLARLRAAHADEALPLAERLNELIAKRELVLFKPSGEPLELVAEFHPRARVVIDALRDIEWQAERSARSVLSPGSSLPQNPVVAPPEGVGAGPAVSPPTRRPFLSWLGDMARIVRGQFPRLTSRRKDYPT